MPSMKELKGLLPCYRPYRLALAVGLAVVVVSTAVSSVILWLLSLGIDSLNKGASLSAIRAVAGAIVGGSLIMVVMRHGTRHLMNGPRHILVDGVPIRDLPLADWRRAIGFVQQESILFSDTVAASIGYGSSDDESIGWAARTPQMETTIAEFPGGHETMLGERGTNLSGGQKQRRRQLVESVEGDDLALSEAGGDEV